MKHGIGLFGYDITMDVDSLRYAALDLDRTADSRAYLQELEGSPYFVTEPPIKSDEDLLHRLQSGDISMALQIPPDFGKDLHRGANTEIAAWIDGSMPFRAETIGGYLQGIHTRFLQDRGLMPSVPLTLEMRYLYNQSFESINAMVPAVIGLLLVFIPAILSALSVVREKEMGSIANMYVTPVTRLEFILGKQLPYILFAMVSFLIVLLMAPKPLLSYPTDTLTLPSPDSLKLRWTAAPGVVEYLISVRCDDTLEYGKYLESSTSERNRRIERSYEQHVPLDNDVSRWGFIPNTEVATVWSAFKWFGRNTVAVYATDNTISAWFKLTHFGANPTFDPLYSNVTGGLGVFAAASVIEAQSFVVKNQP